MICINNIKIYPGNIVDCNKTFSRIDFDCVFDREIEKKEYEYFYLKYVIFSLKTDKIYYNFISDYTDRKISQLINVIS